MSDETLHIPARHAGRVILPGLVSAALTLARRLFAATGRRRTMHVEDLTSRDRADLGVMGHDAWRTDPRSSHFTGPHGF